MKQRRQVALLIETSNEYGRGLLRGVYAYVREHEPWSVYLGEQRRGEPAPEWLNHWDGDGIIARVENLAIAEAVRQSGRPAVDVSAARLLPDAPYVETDDVAFANVAAEHLLERGFTQFAFCGDARFRWSDNRQACFVRRIEQSGHTCTVFPAVAATQDNWAADQAALAAWVSSLPKPIGLMTCYDIRGRQVLDACRRQAIAVPDAVAVIGVDNDPLVCELSDPPLTSVIPDTARSGYAAAALLDRMMQGEQIDGAHLFAPIGIATRLSTDVLAITDPYITSAVRYIREHAYDGIKVEHVLRHVPLSRRVLESRFKKLLGRSPHEEIVRVRVERIKQLLIDTELPLASIAARVGFLHEEYMSVAFKRSVGLPPSIYRAQHRRG